MSAHEHHIASSSEQESEAPSVLSSHLGMKETPVHERSLLTEEIREIDELTPSRPPNTGSNRLVQEFKAIQKLTPGLLQDYTTPDVSLTWLRGQCPDLAH